MQVVMKCFLLNLEKKLAQVCHTVFKKNVKAANSDKLKIQKMMSPSRRLDYSNNQLNC